MPLRPTRRPLLAAAGVVLSAAILVGCGGGTSEDESQSEASAALAHIHGLGVGPTDGRTYVATHEGLYTVTKGGKPKLVGDRQDDFMGFTVARDGTFLASGHGADGSGRPANLGLIASEDGGKTWSTVSLSGDADFHALESADGIVYGYEGGRVRASTDRKTWTDRATLDALDLAVSTADRDLLLATTADGVVRSTDGGRTFGTADGQVQAYLSWPAKDALFGIGTDGRLSRSTDGGKTWTTVGTVPGGTPQALTAVSAQHVLAATQSGAYESRDGGKTFTQLAGLS